MPIVKIQVELIIHSLDCIGSNLFRCSNWILMWVTTESKTNHNHNYQSPLFTFRQILSFNTYSEHVFFFNISFKLKRDSMAADPTLVT